MMMLVAIGLPLLAGVLSLVVGVRFALRLNAAAALGSLVSSALMAVASSPIVPSALNSYLRADGLSIVLAIVVSAASTTAALAGIRAFCCPDGPAHDARRYAVVASLLHAALLCTSFSDHMGVMWISMELAAVLSTMLVGLHGDRPTLEAAFKYMMLGSAGLVLSLLATALVYRAGVAAVGEGDTALSFHALKNAGVALSPRTLRLALALAAVGYGCKVGLFPLHVWKPDAYASAPAPVAGLLAGAAVAVPMGALLRFGALATSAGQKTFVQNLYLIAGVISILAACLFSVRERDLRRVLAFTSVEHMGICILGFGLSTDGFRGGLIHLVTNGILKSLTFGLLGFIVAERGTAAIDKGPGLYGRSNALLFAFLAAIAASVGFPPFGIFASELTILRAAFATGHIGLAIVVVLALGAIFGVVFSASLRMVFARTDEPLAQNNARNGGHALWIAIPALAVTVAMGIAMPTSVFEWLGKLAVEIGG